MKTMLGGLAALFCAAGLAAVARCEEPTALPQLTLPSNRFRMGFQLVTFDAKGSKSELIEGIKHSAAGPDWSPDGKQLLFTTTPTGHSQVYVLDVASGETRNLTNTANGEHQPAWSPDGKQIMFTSERDGNHEIYVMEADGSHPRNLTRDNGFDSDPAWSPDGKRILFGSNRKGDGFRLYVMNADGSEVREAVDRNLGGWTNPDWSPDGQQILFSGFLSDGSLQIFVSNADGQGIEALTEGPGSNSFAAWSPDGGYIAYLHFEKAIEASPEGARLMVIELDTGVHSEIAPGDMRCGASRIAWKPAAN